MSEDLERTRQLNYDVVQTGQANLEVMSRRGEAAEKLEMEATMANETSKQMNNQSQTTANNSALKKKLIIGGVIGMVVLTIILIIVLVIVLIVAL